jgi:uncharacterized protein (UPF0332 family)
MTIEQQQLLEKALDSLRAAKLLVKEEFNDIAVSRAYYAMFYIAEAFLIGKFGEVFSRTGRLPVEFHRYLIQSEQSRIKADYDATSKASNIEATEQISRAEEFILLAQQQL